MKKWIVLLGVVGFCNVYAADPVSTLTAPTPQQAYVSTQSPAVEPVTTPPPPSNVTQPAPSVTADTTSVRLQLLESHDVDMISAIRALNQDVMVLQQQVQTLHQQLQQMESAQPVSVSAGPASWFHYGNINIMPNWIAVGLLVLIAGTLLLRNTRKQKVAAATSAQPEYDFMNTHEAIPAKLDLARSYLAMGNKEDACDILRFIVHKGNAEQRSEAEQLLQKI